MSASAAEIWVIDDDRALVEALEAVLSTDADWTVRTFTKPSDLLACDADPPDLVILDVLMPDMNGYELMTTLRERERFESVPLVVLTALTDDDNLTHAFSSGADDVVRKPFSAVELKERVRAQLKARAMLLELRRAKRHAEYLTELANSLNSSLNTRDVLMALVSRTAQALRVDRCSIILLAQRGSTYDARLMVASDDSALTDMPLDLQSYPEIRHVIESKEPLIIDDVVEAPLLSNVLPGIMQAGVRAMALFPMAFRGELVGVLFLRTLDGSMSLRDPDLALATANVAAIAIHNAGLFEEMGRERARLAEAMAQLSATKDLLTNLIDSSAEPIVAADTNGAIIVFNQAAQDVLGYKTEEMIGSDVRQLYPEGGAQEVLRLLRDTEHDQPGRLHGHQLTLLDVHRRPVPVSMSAAIVQQDGTDTATIGVFTDLRERIRMERELAQANERTRRHTVATELAGAAAHELNQPLTSVLGYAELLGRRLDDGDEAQRKMLDKLVAQAERMSDIVKRIGRITQYKTKPYVGDTMIVDLDQSDSGSSVVVIDNPPPVPRTEPERAESREVVQPVLSTGGEP